MTDDQRAAMADLVLLAVAAVATIYIVRTPPLRRAAWRLLKYGLFTAGPSLVWQETTRAWAQTAHNHPRLGTDRA